MTNPSFPSGVGTPIIRDAASDNLNNPTTTKQSVTASSGLVVLASNQATARYWHADISLGSVPAAPTSSFTASAASGPAPFEVTFTDTSTGSPTSWAWNFGDGTTSTERNPVHTFTAPGTYTVTLTAANAAGPGSTASQTITVTAPPTGGGGAVTVVSNATATDDVGGTAVTVARPAGVAEGDVMIAQFTADFAPTVSSAPAGWAPVVDPLDINARATLFAYYKVAGSAEPTSYTWQLSAAQPWNAGVTAYRGVDGTTPFDTAASTAVQTVAATSLTVPQVTTTTDGAMVVGGVGLNNRTSTVTPPAGWTESWEGTGGQVSELAHRSQPTAGPTGDATWTYPATMQSAGWVRALRPAAGGEEPPTSPTSAFTASTTSGQAPLAVTFTDTSTGEPSAWAWEFGDGGTSTEQSPTYTFTTPGTYTVRLTASNAAGTGAPATATMTVTGPAATPVSSFDASPVSGVAP
ncbi:PKD domain-containing protein, partial [Geodermatophilus sp. YIM 151500]|nr:PKD domain-containing protein [Geodermatophilus sp. YIM 151500]